MQNTSSGVNWEGKTTSKLFKDSLYSPLMIALEQISSLKEYLQTAQSVLIILGPDPTNDQLAVASATYLGLKALKSEVGIFAPKKIEGPFASLKEINTELGKQNLIVEFDYHEDAIDKVSYHIGEENNKFYLTIKPKKGKKPLDKASVDFHYAGADADLIFLVGVHDLEDLNQLYFGYESLYENAFVVTLNSFQPEIGTVQIDLSGTSSLSESLVGLLDGLEIPINEEMATDLLRGIETNTQGLQSFSASAETFEIVAKLLRSGGRRTKKIINPIVHQSQKSHQKPKQQKRQDIVIKKQNKPQKQSKLQKQNKPKQNRLPKSPKSKR
ncbi:MAG: hypothetical protein ABII10_02690 [Candidatus Paceibacterota bacterium]